MRVLLVSQEYPPHSAHGGIGTQTWNKAHGLTERGHDVEVLSCGSDDGPTLKTEVESGVVVHRMRPPGPGIPVSTESAYLMGYSWAVLEQASALRKRGEFDLLNFPEYGGEGFAYFLNREMSDPATVVQLHGPLGMFTERIGWPTRETLLYKVGALMEQVSIEEADALMASSANIADFAASAYRIDRSSIHVVHCGIDADLFSPAEHLRSDRPTILFVGNLERSKGAGLVFDAMMAIRHAYPDVLLRFVGRGGDDLARSISERARREGAEDNIEFVGFVKDRTHLPQLYRSADVFASPAQHEVGVANVYVEAMACGCPVIACVTGGAPEAVVDGVSGVLVPPGDVDATASAFDRILGDSALRERLGANGRQRVLDYFALDHYLDRVLDAYNGALSVGEKRVARGSANAS